MKKRFLTKKQYTNLHLATTDELFTEVMKRVRAVDSYSCYFVDSHTAGWNKGWNLHNANNDVFAKQVK
jgi:hypothetical protein